MIRNVISLAIKNVLVFLNMFTCMHYLAIARVWNHL